MLLMFPSVANWASKTECKVYPITHTPVGNLLPIALLSQLQPIFYEDRFVLLSIAQFVSCLEAFHSLISLSLLNHSNLFAM